MATTLLYRIPEGTRTHHSDEFSLSPATFTFRLPAIVRAFRRYVEELDVRADKYIVDKGEKREHSLAVLALAEIEGLEANTDDMAECPSSTADILHYVLGNSFQKQIVSAFCNHCGISYTGHELIESIWTVVGSDENGSAGRRLACPRGHFVYAFIESVID